jgi:hypothetical protein
MKEQMPEKVGRGRQGTIRRERDGKGWKKEGMMMKKENM